MDGRLLVRSLLYHRATTAPVTGNDRGGGHGDRHPTEEQSNRPTDPFEEPAVDSVTLARRVRAVERALSGVDGVDLDTGGPDPDDLEPAVERLETRIETVETRLDALDSAVRAAGECIVARDRVRRTDDGTESVRRAVEALPESGNGAGGLDPSDDDIGDDRAEDSRMVARDPDSGTFAAVSAADGDGRPSTDESAAEWLDRVAAGGVTPPSVQ